MADEDTLKKLFSTSDLDVIVYRELVDHIAPDGLKAGDLFDLRVQTNDRGALRSNNVEIGVAYFPGGPVLKGIQSIRAGQVLTFPKLPFKPGAELVVAMSDPTEVQVDAYRGGGAPAAQASPQSDPVGSAAKSIGPWALGALLIWALVHEGAKKIPGL